MISALPPRRQPVRAGTKTGVVVRKGQPVCKRCNINLADLDDAHYCPRCGLEFVQQPEVMSDSDLPLAALYRREAGGDSGYGWTVFGIVVVIGGVLIALFSTIR